MTGTKIKQLVASASASLVLALGLAGGVAAASQVECPEGYVKQGNTCEIQDDCPQGSFEQGNNCKVVICHRSNSVENPYQNNPVDLSAVDGVGKGDHLLEHLGPVFNPNTTYPTPHNGDQWGDIIPPVAGVEDGLNWTAEGQAVYNNGGCDGVYTPPTGGSGGSETPTSPQVLGEATQVTTKPVGSVSAGNGGAKELSPASVVGLTGSLAVLVTGAAFAVKRFVRL